MQLQFLAWPTDKIFLFVFCLGANEVNFAQIQ